MRIILETEYLRAEITELPKSLELDETEFGRALDLFKYAALGVGFSSETVKDAIGDQ